LSTELQEKRGFGLKMVDCSICGSSMNVTRVRTADDNIICKGCRCQRCNIPMSLRPCQNCGEAHGKPSSDSHLCESCFVGRKQECVK